MRRLLVVLFLLIAGIGFASEFRTASSAIYSKTLTDNVKAGFIKVAVASGSYEGGSFNYTLYCADASDRVTRSGRISFSEQNTGGTETCTIAGDANSGDSTNNAKSFSAVTWTCADGGTNTVQFEVQANCSITTPTTMTIEFSPVVSSGGYAAAQQ